MKKYKLTPIKSDERYKNYIQKIKSLIFKKNILASEILAKDVLKIINNYLMENNSYNISENDYKLFVNYFQKYKNTTPFYHILYDRCYINLVLFNAGIISDKEISENINKEKIFKVIDNKVYIYLDIMYTDEFGELYFHLIDNRTPDTIINKCKKYLKKYLTDDYIILENNFSNGYKIYFNFKKLLKNQLNLIDKVLNDIELNYDYEFDSIIYSYATDYLIDYFTDNLKLKPVDF